MNLQNNGDDQNPFCYFHPNEKLVGVCAFCLKEKLLILLSKQAHHSLPKDTRSSYNFRAIPKIFAFGSFLHRSKQKSVDFEHDDHTSTSSQEEDSFISIKFENNGVVSWDKEANSKTSTKPIDDQKPIKKGTPKTLVEHVKPQATSLWWRKRIGQIFHVARWKRSNKANACHVGNKVGGVKVRRGWIRTLSSKKKRTME